jgi:hypothetical protein
MYVHMGLARTPQQNIELVNPIGRIFVFADLYMREGVQAESHLPRVEGSLARALWRAHIILLQHLNVHQL